MVFNTNIKTWYQITLSYRPIIEDFHSPSPIAHIKRHKSCNCTYSAEIFRDSFTPVAIHTLSLPARSRTSFINCFPSSLPAYGSQNLYIEWNLVDVGNITLVIITDPNECAAFAVHARTTETYVVFCLKITETIRIYIRILLVVTLPFESVGCVAIAYILIHLFMKLILDIRSRKIGERQLVVMRNWTW